MAEIVAAAEDDIRHLAQQIRTGQSRHRDAEPDLIITFFGDRSLVDEAPEPEAFRRAVSEVLNHGGTVEHLIAPPSTGAASTLVALVPHMISYLARGGSRYQVHVITEAKHPLTYGICSAGDRSLLIIHGHDDQAVAAHTSDPRDAEALRTLLHPFWRNKEPIIRELFRRSTESVRRPGSQPPIGLEFEHALTSVESAEGPRRLAKEGLSVLNIPVAIRVWKWRAAELRTAGWIPEDLLVVLQENAWDLATQGIRYLPREVTSKYADNPLVGEALKALEDNARNIQIRQGVWADQLSRHEFWDACPKSALTRFIATGALPPDDMPPACGLRAERDDIETIITRLIARLRSNRNYHLALIDDLFFLKQLYFEVKVGHVLAHVFTGSANGERRETAIDGPGDSMLSVLIDNPPIADAFAGWFDECVITAATDPAWNDNRSVANWLEKKLQKSRPVR